MKKKIPHAVTNIVLAVFCLILFHTQNAHAWRVWDYIYANFEFLPEFHLDADLFTFFNHKNSYFKTRYYLENNTNLDFVLISYKKIVYSVWDFQFQTGMGQTPGNIVFDPKDISFGIIPAFEFRIPYVNIQFGNDHHCFHEIDTLGFPTVYYNKGFIAAGSKNMRLYDYWTRMNEDGGWTFLNRVSWYCKASYYVKDFFGLIGPWKINGVNPNVFDCMLDMRFAFYMRRSWIFDARGATTIGYFKRQEKDAGIISEEKGTFWRQDFGIESMFRRGKRGGILFATFTLDHLPLYSGNPRFSKDRLLQIGIRFFY